MCVKYFFRQSHKSLDQSWKSDLWKFLRTSKRQICWVFGDKVAWFHFEDNNFVHLFIAQMRSPMGSVLNKIFIVRQIPKNCCKTSPKNFFTLFCSVWRIFLWPIFWKHHEIQMTLWGRAVFFRYCFYMYKCLSKKNGPARGNRLLE